MTHKINVSKLSDLILYLGYIFTFNFYLRFQVNGHRLTCVACHPTELCVATGDNLGRVLIWRDIIDNPAPPMAVYHWHTLPVADVVFSQSGISFSFVSVTTQIKLTKSHLVQKIAPIDFHNISVLQAHFSTVEGESAH